MIAFILKRLLIAVPTLLILIVLCFLLMYAAPGGPFTREQQLPPEVIKNLNTRYGLNDPLYKQIWNYLTAIVTQFDFGPSFVYKDRTVNQIVAQGFPITLYYGSISFLVACIVGISLGIVAALYRNTWIDYLAVGISIGAQVLPNFVLAPLLVLVFTVFLGWLPGGGWEGGKIEYLILPVIALSTSFMASIARITRASMLETLNADYIRTARSKGLSQAAIVSRHALKPALLPLISYLSPVCVGMITGSVVIDVYFSTGGIGKNFVDSALNRDYAVMMGITILVGTLIILFNLLADILHAWIDPRVRS